MCVKKTASGLVLAVLIVLCGFSCTKEDAFFPAKEGTVLVYKLVDRSGGWGEDMRRTVTKTERFGGNTKVIYDMEGFKDNNIHTIKEGTVDIAKGVTEFYGGGLFFLDVLAMSFSDSGELAHEGKLRLSSKINAGAEFDDMWLYVKDEKIRLTNIRCVAVEDVTVKAGTFKMTYKFRYEIKSGINNTDFEVTEWFAKDIGTVKGILVDGMKNSTTELIKIEKSKASLKSGSKNAEASAKADFAEAPKIMASYESLCIALIAVFGDEDMRKCRLDFDPPPSRKFTYAVSDDAREFTATALIDMGEFTAGSKLISRYDLDSKKFVRSSDKPETVNKFAPRLNLSPITSSKSESPQPDPSAIEEYAANAAAPYFRIQIHAAEEHVRAFNVFKEAYHTTHHSVSIGFEQSLFKVFVGKFKTSEEAKAALPEIKAIYPDAWIKSPQQEILPEK